MIPRPAQYLLRFDDLCPTVSHNRWQRLLPLIAEFGIRPILAVVPDNRDTALQHSQPDPEFWERMRRMEAAGAAIALHGYHHFCNSKGRSLVPLHRHSEFAGIPEETQHQWIHTGLRILRVQGLNPRIWVAPRHGFDRATLRALQQEGINLLSDGLARVPFTRYGFTWIPQQLWVPEEKPKGLWTICLHVNSLGSSLVNQLHIFLSQHPAQFTSVDRVLAEFPPARLDPSEWLYEAFALSRAQASRIRKKLWRRLRRARKG
jgi:predicted deacetylase